MLVALSTAMKPLVLLLACLLAETCLLQAQTYHTPAEIRRIMATSRLVYSVVLLDSSHVVRADTYDTRVIEPGRYFGQDSTGRHRKSGTYATAIRKDTAMSALYDTAETCLVSGSVEKARSCYLTLLEKYPDNALLLTRAGQTWQKSSDSSRAKEYFLKAIHINPNDFMAHYLLANQYDRENNPEQAIAHITTAHLLNRNDTAIRLSLQHIYEKNGMLYDNWEFRPRYALTQKSGDEREIAIDSAEGAWLLYAFCMALWEFEPDYSMAMMQNASSSSFTLRELESMSVMADFARNLYPSDTCPTFLARLQEAIKNGDLETFAMYEVFMRRTPETGMMMDEHYRNSMRDFIMKYHVQLR